MTGLFYQADQMAKSGLGWEDIWVTLRDKGLSRYQARVSVFGKAVARRMERRDAMRERERKVA